MKKNKLNEDVLSKSKKSKTEVTEKEDQDAITSTLALQHDLKAKISKNPFASSRIKQPKRLIVVLENASLDTVIVF